MFAGNLRKAAAALLICYASLHRTTNAEGNYAALIVEIQQWQRTNPELCGQDTSTCGVQRLVDRFAACDEFRIVNGCDVAKYETMGWQAAISINGFRSSFCSGTLVSARHVVVAAECFISYIGRTPKDAITSIQVTVGALAVSVAQPSETYDVVSFATHPIYSQNSSYNAAIVKLSRDVPVSSSNIGIRPVCLPTTATPRSFKNCVVSGYGVESPSPLTGHGTLRYAVMQAVSSMVCSYSYKEAFSENVTFCAVGSRKKDTVSLACSGDLGGGLICKDENSGRWMLQGIATNTSCEVLAGLYADAFELDLRSASPATSTNRKCIPAVPPAESFDPAAYLDTGVSSILAGAISTTTTSAPTADPPSYKQLVEEARQWQQANPEVCGRDTPTCGVQRLLDQFENCDGFRITKGCDVQNHKIMGWAVKFKLLGSAMSLHCSGTLVSPRHVATAAHCLKIVTAASQIVVTIGVLRSGDVAPQEQTYGVESFAYHLRYKSSGVSSFDAGLIKLNRSVDFVDVDGGIRPACLPSAMAVRSSQSRCLLAGYGYNDEYNRTGSGSLRYSVFQVLSNKACAFYYASSFVDPLAQFCAIGHRNGHVVDSCQGDSGGGVICKDERTKRWTLQGIVSYGGSPCGKRPGVYADPFNLGLRLPEQTISSSETDQCQSAVSALSVPQMASAMDEAVDSIVQNSVPAAITGILKASVIYRRDFSELVTEIQQWQRKHPTVCGKDTSACAIQQQIDRFQRCNSYRLVNGCQAGRERTTGWQVSVQVNGTVCGGTLLTSRHVALAAHCFRRLGTVANIQAVVVIVGAFSNFNLPKSQYYEVESLAVHPSYKIGNSQYDAAVIRLDRDVPLTVNGIRPACLAQKSMRSFGQCILAGYGVEDGKLLSRMGILRYSVLQAVSDSACEFFYGTERGSGTAAFAKSVSFCAMGYNSGNTTETCLGDVGSGLVCKDEQTGRWFLQGIASYAHKQCGKWPGLFGDAHALGFQDSLPVARQSITADPCKAKPPAVQDDISTFPDMTKYMDDIVAEFRRQKTSDNPTLKAISVSGISVDIKKPSGVARTATETIREFGCESYGECESNVCKPIVLCIKDEKIASKASARTLTHGGIINWKLRHKNNMPKTRVFKRQVPEEDNYLLIHYFDRFYGYMYMNKAKICANVDICWSKNWLRFYASKIPTFDLSNV